jgi:hypothetical protein
VSGRLGTRTKHSVRPELFDRVLLLDSFPIDLLDPQVVFGVAAPILRVSPQPPPRVALAHLDERPYELLVEQFWTVRPGESFGSIAHATGISIVTLEQLNPKLKPASVQTGNRVRLRR